MKLDSSNPFPFGKLVEPRLTGSWTQGVDDVQLANITTIPPFPFLRGKGESIHFNTKMSRFPRISSESLFFDKFKLSFVLHDSGKRERSNDHMINTKKVLS